MSSSDEGSAAPPAFDRTNRSGADSVVTPGSAGFQSVAGASVSAIATLRGPVRRSRYCASDWRHEPAACCRSAGVIVTCISLSASANVCAVTSGPEPAPVPKVGGAPAVVGVDEVSVGVAELRHALAATNAPRGALIRNWRRVFILSVAFLLAQVDYERHRSLAGFISGSGAADGYFLLGVENQSRGRIIQRLGRGKIARAHLDF